MKQIVALLLTTALLSGCASIVKGYRETINISTSNGQKAEAVMMTGSGQRTIMLPQAVSVKSGNQDIIINVKETQCYNASTTVVQSDIHPFFWGNIILLSVLGSATDAVSGAMWTYEDDVIVDISDKGVCYPQYYRQ